MKKNGPLMVVLLWICACRTPVATIYAFESGTLPGAVQNTVDERTGQQELRRSDNRPTLYIYLREWKQVKDLRVQSLWIDSQYWKARVEKLATRPGMIIDTFRTKGAANDEMGYWQVIPIHIDSANTVLRREKKPQHQIVAVLQSSAYRRREVATEVKKWEANVLE